MKENKAAKRVLFVTMGLIPLGLVLVACSGDAATEEPVDEEQKMDAMEDGEEMEHDTEHEGSSVDSDAPVFEILAKEFEFSPSDFEVSAGAFTIQVNDEGAIEHDFVIEGAEDQGGAHVQPGGDAQNTFDLEAGTYTFYCTVPGHRDAGMEGTITITE